MAKSKGPVPVPLAELVEDLDLYPRHSVDTTNVQSLALALEAGANLPPVVACSKSKRIVDGWHRCRAYRRVVGNDAVIDVELINYPNEAELFADAVRRNASHGRRLDAIDQTRAIHMLEKFGWSSDRIAITMNVPTQRVEKLRIKVAYGDGGNTVIPGTKTITLKRPVQHLVGQELTPAQTKVHDMLPGTSFLLIAKQLSEALRQNMVDLTDVKLVSQLKTLRKSLNEALRGI